MGDFFTDTMNNIGKQFKKVGDEAGRECDRIGKRVNKNIEADGTEIQQGIQKNGFGGGLCAAVDVFSPGHQSANLLDDAGLVQDPAMKQMIAAGINMTAGAALPGVGLLWQLDSIAEFGDGLGKLGKGGQPAPGSQQTGQSGQPVQCSEPHSVDSPSKTYSRKEMFQEAKEAAKAHQREVAIDAAKHKAKEKTEYNAGYQAGLRDGEREHMHHALPVPYDGIAPGRSGWGDGGYGTTIDINIDLGDLIKKNDGHKKSKSKLEEILNDPNMSFEDKIFQIMLAIQSDQESEVDGFGKELTKDDDLTKKMRDGMDDKIDSLREKIAKESDPKKREELQAQLGKAQTDRSDFVNDHAESREKLVEKMKSALDKLTEMQQTLSNVLNTMHENAMSTIRNIK